MQKRYSTSSFISSCFPLSLVLPFPFFIGGRYFIFAILVRVYLGRYSCEIYLLAFLSSGSLEPSWKESVVKKKKKDNQKREDKRQL